MESNEILTASYWEHFKFAKEIAMIYPLNHPKRVKIENSLNQLQEKIGLIK